MTFQDLIIAVHCLKNRWIDRQTEIDRVSELRKQLQHVAKLLDLSFQISCGTLLGISGNQVMGWIVCGVMESPFPPHSAG